MTFLAGETTVTVVSIDPVTGVQTPLLPTAATGVVGSSLTIDPASRRVFFEDTGIGTASLIIADLARGTVSQVPFALCCPPLVWDPAGRRLIGLIFLPGETTVTAVSIDPVTAEVTPLVPTTATGVVGGTVTIDPATRRVFFEDSNTLFVVNLANGTVSQTPLPCCPPLVWDTGGGRLIGLNFLGQATLTVVSIDPSTGLQTSLLPTTSGGVAGGYVTIDPDTGRVFFVDPFLLSLFTANLRSGSVSQSPLALCCPPIGWLAAAPVSAVPMLDARGIAILTVALALLGWRLAGSLRS